MPVRISIDHQLLEHALRLGEHRCASDLVEQALKEFIARRDSLDLMALYGAGGICDQYNYKAARALPESNGRLGSQSA